MATFLFDKIVFGPVKSRRLGVSLGINLLPLNRKLCNFNCIYCECGWTPEGQEAVKKGLPSRQKVFEALDRKLSEMKAGNRAPDVITYAGNGEPTLHPEFPGIIDDSILLRDKYFPEARIAVLSNATTIGRPEIREALMKVDQNILKLDSAFDQTVKIHNQPRVSIKVAELIKNLSELNGQLIIQTLFLRGSYNGRMIDNTTPGELSAWLDALKKIQPSEVMIYTIHRDTPSGSELRKVPAADLKRIAAMVNSMGIKTRISC
ncbi:MAG TPA: radical SAM protein [Bacteroidales bacterium]|jgi:wyosine [tRNA(Phe)-imidazoG37] synthetase (radical SAM superfamily)|nr:radical SAM protein [Bacteroidales bacterium]HQH23814.1 radical SAM protein [Bacteroidales bacterium]HQJ81639.1 radical SAM protein [Bacteroidales bacterium]